MQIGSRIARKDTPFSDAISVKERLAMTLRFSASEYSYKSLCYLFKIFGVANQECTTFVLPIQIQNYGENHLKGKNVNIIGHSLILGVIALYLDAYFYWS